MLSGGWILLLLLVLSDVVSNDTWQLKRLPFIHEVTMTESLYTIVPFEELLLTMRLLETFLSDAPRRHCMTGVHHPPPYWASQTISITSDSTMLWSADDMFQLQPSGSNAQDIRMQKNTFLTAWTMSDVVVLLQYNATNVSNTLLYYNKKLSWCWQTCATRL